MEGSRFDAWIRTTVAATATRRGAWRAFAGGGLGVVGLRSGGADAAAGQGTCRRLGRPCERDRDCCTRRCRKGKCACQPGTVKNGQDSCLVTNGTCPSAGNFCGTDVECGATDEGFQRFCFLQTNGAGFCGNSLAGPGCSQCTNNAQCVVALGPGAACVKLGQPDCGCPPGGRVCMLPCPNPV